MTITEDIGKFKTKIRYDDLLGSREREVEFDVTWVSCGVYQMSYYRPLDAKSHEIMVVEDWYPPDTNAAFTPEQFEKVIELYPTAPKHERNECYKPFYEDYDLDRGMFDFEYDRLFQAFRDPLRDRVYLVNRYFVHGSPVTSTSVLGLSIEDLQRLKELLTSNEDKIFYSGCKIAMPSKTLEDLKRSLEGQQNEN